MYSMMYLFRVPAGRSLADRVAPILYDAIVFFSRMPTPADAAKGDTSIRNTRCSCGAILKQ